MTLNDLRAFAAFVAHGSMSRAAQRLHVSQPALSRRIKSLETDLGATLLDRSTKPPRITAVGKHAYERAQAVLRETGLLRQLVQPNGAPTGTIRIGAAQPLTDATSVPAVRVLKDRFPKLHIEIHSDWSPELLQKVHLGQLDVASIMLAPHAMLPEGIAGVHIGTEPMFVVAALDYPIRRAPSLAETARHAWVLYPDKGCACRAALKRTLEGKGYELRVAVSDYWAEQQLALVAEQAGLGLVPKTLLASSRFRSKVRVLSVKDLELASGIWVVHAPYPNPLEQAIACYTETITRHFGKKERTRKQTTRSSARRALSR